MRLIAAVLALVTLPMPAFSEVCDKVNEDWTVASGPIGFWPELLASATSPVGAIAALGCLVIVLRRSATLTLAAALLLAAGAIFTHLFEDTIVAAARAEGCIGPAAASLAPFLALAALMFASGLITRRKVGG